MSKLILIPAVFFLSLFEVVFLPLPLTATFVVLLSLSSTTKVTLLVAFLTGIFLDILSISTIGTSSLLFLSIAFVIMLYKRRFRPKNVFCVFFALFFGILSFEVVRRDFSFTIPTLNLAFVTSLFVTTVWVIASQHWRTDRYAAWTRFS